MVWRAKWDVVVCKWKDKSDVLTNSNGHTPQIATVTNRLEIENQKPSIVRDDNHSMSGIVRSDQILSFHSGLRKSLRWYKKAGVNILEIFITNAFYLYRKFSSHAELCHLVGIWLEKEKKADQWHPWPTSTTQKLFLIVKRRRNQQGVAGNAWRKKDRNEGFRNKVF